MMDTEVSRVKSLLRALALYAEARGRLLQIEAQEAGMKFSEILIIAAILSGCLLFGWMLALPAIVFLISQSQGWAWWQVALGAAGLHFVLGVFFLIALKTRLQKLRVFEETFHQFQRDREWIGHPPSES